MPKITDDNVKVKRTFSQGMPKNLSEYMDNINEKFLDNHLATVEDFSLKFHNDDMTQMFKEYQNRYFNSVLLKDSFLKIDEDGNFGTIRNYRPMSIQNVGFMGSLTNKVLGAEVETDGTTSNPNNSTQNFIDVGRCTTFVANTWYDQTKFHINVASGNVRTCIYLDSSNTPDVLGGESASIAAVADYTTIYPIGECQILTTTGWIGHNCSSSALRWHYWAAGGTYRHYATFTFGAFPNPLTGDTAAANSSNVMKASHS